MYLQSLRNLIKCNAYRIIRNMGRILLYPVPIRKNQIIFLSHRGGCQYSDSPRVITEYLRDNYPGQFNLIWIVNDLEKFKFLEKEGIKIVRFRTFKEFYYLNTSRVCVTNCGFNFYLIKRKDQLMIHTLHGGGAYKSNIVTRDGHRCSKKEMAYSVIKNNEFDIFLSGSKISSECIIRGDFGYTGKILENGMPRNDVIFADNESVIKKVRYFFGIDNNKKIVLVAPTWRSDGSTKNIDIDYKMLTEKLSACYGDEWVVLLRLHHLSNIDIKPIIKENAGIVYDATCYTDIQELIVASDILISDFSSLIWDFALTKKPILLYVPDLSDYINDRGFAVPFKSWGLLYAENMPGLLEIIESVSINELKEISQNHLKIFGSFENGYATENICSLIKDYCSDGYKA